MRSFWDLVKYFNSRWPEKTALEEAQEQRTNDWTGSRSTDEFGRNGWHGDYNEGQDNELDWGPRDQAGDESESWGWDVWKLWW